MKYLKFKKQAQENKKVHLFEEMTNASVKLTQYKFSTWSLRQMLCGSHIKIWNLANHMKKHNKKYQKARFIDENLKTKSLMFFVAFFPCDIQDFKF